MNKKNKERKDDTGLFSSFLETNGEPIPFDASFLLIFLIKIKTKTAISTSPISILLKHEKTFICLGPETRIHFSEIFSKFKYFGNILSMLHEE